MHRKIVGLDIGTSKVVAIVGQLTDDGQLRLAGLGSYPSAGLKRGVVVNIEATVHAVSQAIEEAEVMTGESITSVYVGIAGNHVKSLDSNGIVAIRGQFVTEHDIERVIDAAQALSLPADQDVLHVMPQEFRIDDQDGIKDPLGMHGIRLEAKVHLITCSANARRNIETCVERCGLSVDGVILEQLASGYAVLSEDDKNLGVCLVDIGGGTTDIAIYSEGAIRHTAVIPVAGDQVTNDIAVALRTPSRVSEQIKVKYACALAKLAQADDTIEIPEVSGRGSRRLSRESLAEVVEARYEELFSFVAAELKRSGFEGRLASGVFLTGGSSRVEGAATLAEEVLNIPVSIGIPEHVSGMEDIIKNSVYATSVGLLLYGKQHMQQQETDFSRWRSPGTEKNLFDKFRHFIAEKF